MVSSPDKRKKAFSLPEALMVLLIIGMVAALTTPLLVKKYEKKEYETHGSWECIMFGGNYSVIKRDKKGTIVSQTSSSSMCTFDPPLGARDYIVDICGNHAELENCNYPDGSHVLKYYPTLKRMSGIGIKNNRVYFGNFAFAFYEGGMGRVLIVY